MSQVDSRGGAETQRFEIKVTSIGVLWSAAIVWAAVLSLCLKIDKLEDHVKRMADSLDVLVCVEAYKAGVDTKHCKMLLASAPPREFNQPKT